MPLLERLVHLLPSQDAVHLPLLLVYFVNLNATALPSALRKAKSKRLITLPDPRLPSSPVWSRGLGGAAAWWTGQRSGSDCCAMLVSSGTGGPLLGAYHHSFSRRVPVHVRVGAYSAGVGMCDVAGRGVRTQLQSCRVPSCRGSPAPGGCLSRIGVVTWRCVVG